MSNTIIVIDSGLSSVYRDNHPVHVVEGINFCDTQVDAFSDTIGHGTAIVNIISTLNIDAEFVICKIYDKDLVQDESIFEKALIYILNSYYMHAIIHMSLGLAYHSDRIYKVLRSLYNKGHTMIAAFDNLESISFPAAYDFVVGIEAHWRCTGNEDFIVTEDTAIVDVYAKGGLHRVIDQDNTVKLKQGNSYSAAYVTGSLSRTNYDDNSVASIKKLIKRITTYKISFYSYFDQTDSTCDLTRMKHCAVFPYNKEIINLIHYSEMLPFEISAVYTSKYLGSIGRKVSNFRGDHSYEIKNIDAIDWENIDTLILGHMDELETYTKTQIKKTLLALCYNHMINVYSLDGYDITPEIYNDFKNSPAMLYVPHSYSPYNHDKRGKLYHTRAPVLGVFGTSSKQGKFTLQLALRQKFMQDGYCISQLSSEATGLLYEMDAVVPFGYNSHNDLTDYVFIDTVNSLIHSLDKEETEIILVGSQSRTTIESYNNLGHMAVKQIEFLIAVNPDAIILCVNPNDDMHYISKTLRTIEGLSRAKVICLAVFPFFADNDWKARNNALKSLSETNIEAVKKRYEKEYDIPCFSLADETDIHLIYTQALDFFSEVPDE
jgi:hypothetical protein